MKIRTTCWLLLMAAAETYGQQSAPPQRTITTRPDGGAAVDSSADSMPPMNPAALERYRAMWQKMTPAQQKALVSSGGYTPEQYERMMRQRGGVDAKGERPKGTAPSESGSAPDADAFNSLSRSLQDRNAIRDGNLSLVQKDGCPPELASRISDLKARLLSDERELTGAAAPAASLNGARSAEGSGAADPLTVAAGWFKGAGDHASGAGASDGARAKESKLLDAALAGTETAGSPERADAKSPDAERNRKLIEDDITRVKAELEQLSGACAARK